MNGFKLLIPTVFLLSLVCLIGCDPIPQSSTTGDEKKEVGLKPEVPAEAPSKKSEATPDKSTGTVATGSTPSPQTCGGLKGFLNLCHEKKEDSTKQRRSLSENEEDSEGTDIDPEKEIEETDEGEQERKRDIPVMVSPSSLEVEVRKRQIEEDENAPNDEIFTPNPALNKRQAPSLDAAPQANLTSDKPPAPLSSEINLPIPSKRQVEESEEGDNTDESDETDDGVDDDDDDNDDDDDDDSDKNDETEKR